jgi:hypothetical protein
MPFKLTSAGDGARLRGRLDDTARALRLRPRPARACIGYATASAPAMLAASVSVLPDVPGAGDLRGRRDARPAR